MLTILSLLLAQGGETTPPETPVRPELFAKPTYGTVLCDVAMRAKVRATEASKVGTVTMPVPSDYSGQCVIGFRVQVQPESALVSWRWRHRPDGLNRVVEVQLKPGTGDATVSYTARMLVQGFYVVRTQRKNFGDWLGPTAAVPADDPKVIEVASRLREKNQDLDVFVGKALRWAATAPVEGKQEPLRRAEICAAVLRASKIPARLVAIVPRVPNGKSMQEWRVEYRADEGMWKAIDPFVGLQNPVRNSAAILTIASRMDESHGPASPAFSVPEISSELRWAAGNATTPLTEMTLIKDFPRAAMSRLMPAGNRWSVKVDAAAVKGDTVWIDDPTLRRVLARGATNLALYLDGRPTFPDPVKR
jgi:hypothetical protein